MAPSGGCGLSSRPMAWPVRRPATSVRPWLRQRASGDPVQPMAATPTQVGFSLRSARTRVRPSQFRRHRRRLGGERTQHRLGRSAGNERRITNVAAASIERRGEREQLSSIAAGVQSQIDGCTAVIDTTRGARRLSAGAGGSAGFDPRPGKVSVATPSATQGGQAPRSARLRADGQLAVQRRRPRVPERAIRRRPAHRGHSTELRAVTCEPLSTVQQSLFAGALLRARRARFVTLPRNRGSAAPSVA